LSDIAGTRDAGDVDNYSTSPSFIRSRRRG
jgi:hypothetical protein